MRTRILFIITSLIYGSLAAQTPQAKFQPTVTSLEKANPVPEWFKDAKFGIYFHWGVYSVPAFGNEWYPRNMYVKNSSENKHHLEVFGDPVEWPYNNFITGAKDKKGNFWQFAPRLKSKGGKFDPEEWAQLFADAGAKFAGPVAEHHDGFSMWASKVNPWNAKEMGPKQDLVRALTDAIRRKNLKIILSMHHAFNISGFYSEVPHSDNVKLQMLYGQQGKEKNEAFWLNKHKEIIDNYRPDIIWQDFNLHKITDSVLLGFLAYYYNRAAEWKKEVVATYKDGLNNKIAVLDYERGGPTDITENYWLTDDAISNSSWCYTEGIGYYSKKQVLHGFLDRISKNGNLLLNISPKADGTIPQEQKDLLLSMGSWLRKYGEAVYFTRAWEIYGEGPTKMGAAHGVFQAPAEGSAKDVRYTRSKDNTTLYAILLGWDKGQKQVKLNALSTGRINLRNLKKVEMINGAAHKYLPLSFSQDSTGLIINLPESHQEDLAYVIKLSFDGKIPKLEKNAKAVNIDGNAVQLFNGKNLEGWYSFLNSKGRNNDPDKVFLIENSMLQISGKEFGYIATEKTYRNFKLIAEFKWGQKKFPPRDADTTKRDNGICFYFPAGEKDTVWPKSIECQIQEGDVGDIWLIDSTTIQINGTRTNPDNYTRVVKKTDAENPTGEWNVVEIIANNGKVTYTVNGKVVNEFADPSVQVGKILIQSEGAEIYYRKIDLIEL